MPRPNEKMIKDYFINHHGKSEWQTVEYCVFDSLENRKYAVTNCNFLFTHQLKQLSLSLCHRHRSSFIALFKYHLVHCLINKLALNMHSHFIYRPSKGFSSVQLLTFTHSLPLSVSSSFHTIVSKLLLHN